MSTVVAQQTILIESTNNLETICAGRWQRRQVRIAVKKAIKRSTHTQRYEMGKLIDERTVPTHASRQLDLLPLLTQLQDVPPTQRTSTQERQQLLAHVHALVLADASEPWEAVAN